MTEPISYEFNEKVIERAKGITLADLLDCPATQCWVMSMMGNACTYSSHFVDEMQPKDSHLIMVLKALFFDIPAEERSVLFKLTGEFIANRRQRA